VILVPSNAAGFYRRLPASRTGQRFLNRRGNPVRNASPQAPGIPAMQVSPSATTAALPCRSCGIPRYDVAQTDGEPLPNATTASGDPGRRTVELRSAIAAQGIALDDVADFDGALGTSAGGSIQILKAGGCQCP
jgi:hypothetical protein